MMRKTSLDEQVILETRHNDENRNVHYGHLGNGNNRNAALTSPTTAHALLNVTLTAAAVITRDIGKKGSDDDDNDNDDESREEEEKKQEQETSSNSNNIIPAAPNRPHHRLLPAAVNTLPPTPQQQQQQQHQHHLQVQIQPQQSLSPSKQLQPPKDYLRHVTSSEAVAGGSIASKKAGTSWWERVVVQRSSYVVEDLVEQYTADSAFLQSDPFPVAFLDRIEVETGDLLGSGTYSNVYQVKHLELLPDYMTDLAQQDQLRRALIQKSHNNPQRRQQEAQALFHAQTNTSSTTSSGNHPLMSSTISIGTTGYAIKHLKSELLQNSKLFEAAAADLIMEAKYLARLDHENILKLRAMALGGTSTFAATGLFDSYFLVVDEVQETLIQRIHRWRVQGSTDQYQRPMILHKLKLAVQVASALAYLHSKRLCYRDLKPHNIGIKKVPVEYGCHDEHHEAAADVIQLFDFGFCRELPSPDGSSPRPTMVKSDVAAETRQNEDDDHDEHHDHDGNEGNDTRDLEDVDVDSSPTYHANRKENGSGNVVGSGTGSVAVAEEVDNDKLYCMSGKGTLMYMASEVLSSRCYNQKADVYSWSMVTYELLTLQKPFTVGSIEQHKKAVCDRGERPPLDHLRWLSAPVKDLLQYSWEASVPARWHMEDVKDSLDGIIADMETSRRAFRTDRSFGSFGGNSYTNPPKSFLCQGVDMDDIIIDITNTVQTRYEYITQRLFCNGNDASAVNSTAAVAARATDLRNMNGLLKSSYVNTTERTSDTGQEVTLKNYLTTTQGTQSLSFSQSLEVITPTQDKPNAEADAADDDDSPVKATHQEQKQGQEEHKDGGFLGSAQASLSSALWGGPRSLPVHRSSTTSEQFPMTSLCMHSVRLNAARNRKPKSPRITSQSLNYIHDDHPSLIGTASLQSIKASPASPQNHSQRDASDKNEENRQLQTITSDDDGECVQENSRQVKEDAQDEDAGMSALKDREHRLLQTINSDDNEQETSKDVEEEASDETISNSRGGQMDALIGGENRSVKVIDSTDKEDCFQETSRELDEDCSDENGSSTTSRELSLAPIAQHCVPAKKGQHPEAQHIDQEQRDTPSGRLSHGATCSESEKCEIKTRECSELPNAPVQDDRKNGTNGSSDGSSESVNREGNVQKDGENCPSLSADNVDPLAEPDADNSDTRGDPLIIATASI